MAGDSRAHGERSDEELLCAIFEVSKARTLLLGIAEALPEHFQMYGSDIEQLLDRATARLRWLKVTGASAAAQARDQPAEESTGPGTAGPRGP